MKFEQFAKGVIEFAEKELLVSLDGTREWFGAFAIGLIRSRINAISSNISKHPYILNLGIADADGDIDVDMLLEMARNTLKKQGVLTLKVPCFGVYTLGGPAFDKLEEYIKEQK